MRSLFVRGEAGAPPFVPFDVLQFIALFLCILTVLPAFFSKSVKRMKTWLSLMLSCIGYCISFLLLLGQQSGRSPAPSFCVFQAALIYAAPPLVAGAGMSFVLELYFRMSSALNGIKFDEKRADHLLVLGPSAHVIVFWASLFNGVSNLSKVERHPSGMYCHVNDEFPTLVAGVSVIVLLAAMIIIELYTIFLLVRRRRLGGFEGVRTVGQNGLFPVPLFIRTAIFTLAGGLGIIMVDILINSKARNSFAALDVLAIIPLSVALTFGSQLDILRTYVFWRRRPPSPEVEVSSGNGA